MKRFVLTIIFALLPVFLLPVAASAASGDYTVDKVNFTADLRSDGSALITEEWTVTFSEKGADGFGREIAVIDDNFERITGVSDISVSVDGNICSEESSDSLRKGTYTLTSTADSYFVSWYMPSSGETHVFSMRYVVSGAVKLYHERAYFYCRAVNESSNQLCRNMTVTVNTPENCFAEDFKIEESGSLAGEKTDGKVTFFAENTVGLVKVGVSMPADVFQASMLTELVDDPRVVTAGGIIAAVLLVLLIVSAFFYSRNYKRIFRKYWEKECAKKAQRESSYKARAQALKKFSPADVLCTVTEKTVSEADFFIVTLLDLVRRGYISACAKGFSASEQSESDPFGRPLNDNEKRMIRIFSSNRWARLIRSPESFYREVQSFNKKVKFISPLTVLTPQGRKLVGYCFEMKLSAGNHEFVLPAEISDDFFGACKYNVPELIISIINECENGSGDSARTDISRFKRNMFMFRDIYRDGIEKEDSM